MNSRISFYTTMVIIISFFASCSRIVYREERVPKIETQFQQQIVDLYMDLNLKDELRFEIFKNALTGYKYIDFENENILTIIDYSKPSTDKRCYVIDIEKRTVLYNTFIAHGRNSGENYANVFSNIPQSKQSSLGFFQTSDTYMGSNGYSIMLDGLENGINHLAREREIVIHGADYVSQGFIDENGRLGRSWGCPALPKDLSTEIIDVIQGGSCVYIYADDQFYLRNSMYIPEI